MLHVWEAPLARTTKDVDFLGRLDNSPENLERVVREVCTADAEPDGMVFDPATVKTVRIKEDSDYEALSRPTTFVVSVIPRAASSGCAMPAMSVRNVPVSPTQERRRASRFHGRPVSNWLPWRHKERTEKLLSMRLVVPWDRVALGLQVPVLPGKPVPNPVVRARELQKAVLEVGSAADVARAFGITPAGVCQYLTVLRRLPADLLDRVEAEEEPARLKAVSLRKLLGVAKIERVGDRRRLLRELLK